MPSPPAHAYICSQGSQGPLSPLRTNTPAIQQQQTLRSQLLHLLAFSKHVPQGQLGLEPLPVLGNQKS